MRKSNSKQKKTVFTLIELLITIAIVGILAALLMPALSSAQASAKTLICLNNLKQIGNMINYYSTDWDGWLPNMDKLDRVSGLYERLPHLP